MWQWLNGIDERVWVAIALLVLALGVIARVRWIIRPTRPLGLPHRYFLIGQKLSELLAQKGVKKITLKRKMK